MYSGCNAPAKLYLVFVKYRKEAEMSYNFEVTLRVHVPETIGVSNSIDANVAVLDSFEYISSILSNMDIKVDKIERLIDNEQK